MARGGARNRSGPQLDPRSGRSDRRGVSFSALPREGFQGTVPSCPLPALTGRESELWELLWGFPQAAAWDAEPWRQLAVAQYVRVAVRAEDPESPASLVAAVHRFADQIGLTPAGLKENGWALAASAEVDDAPAAATKSAAPAPVRRLRAVE